MTKAWSTRAVHTLSARNVCPRCDSMLRASGICISCRADLSGEIGAELWDASQVVIAAIDARDEVITRIPTLPVPAPVLSRANAATAIAEFVPSTAPDSPVRVQSVLSVAGAALVAIAAIVFTFFNPDLTDFGTRTLVVAGVTVVFLASAWLLAAAKLQFSAEAVGALGAVFVALDIWAVSGSVGNAALGASIAAITLGAVLIVIAITRRLRSWMLAGLVSAAIAPAFLGYAIDNAWTTLAGLLATGCAVLALRLLVGTLEPRFSSTLLAEKVILTVLQFGVLGFVLLQLTGFESPVEGTAGLTQAIALASLAGISFLSARFELSNMWNFFAGGLVVGAVLPIAWITSDWMLALVPAAALLVLTAVALLRPPVVLLLGSWIAMLVMCLPAGGLGLLHVLTLGEFGTFEVPAAAGIASAALGCLVVGLRSKDLRPLGLLGAAWLGVDALLTVTVWGGLALGGQIALGIGLALALGAVSIFVRVATWLRISVVVGAHLLLVLAAALAWRDPALTVAASAAVLVAFAALSRAVADRVMHVGLGYAYALVILGTYLGLRGEEAIVALCIVSSVASAIALGATLLRRVSARSWYAILVVTTVPFVIGIVTVLVDRRGWTGISTAVTFALALTLVLTTRPGLNRYVRAAAAALLVPALAVVAICFGSYWLESSGSPVVLPVIAALVALVLPTTGLMERLVDRPGIADARDVRTAIEISTLVTGGIAVLLAIVLPATGSFTAFLVLTIIALGATATGLLAKRRYAWIVAAVAYTGALWAILSVAHLDTIELYFLPPALVAALLGAIAIARGSDNGLGLYWSGLGIAVFTPLGALVLADPAVGTPWRALGLLAGSLVLIVLTALYRRMPALTTLVTPTLLAAIVAAAAGAMQAVRYGRAVDPTGTTDAALIAVALGFSVPAAVLAAVAGRRFVASTATRWAYAPALAILVAGPITAVRVELSTAWTMWTLMAALLALLVATVVTRSRTLPPVWFTFALAWAVAVAGWSTREWFRVEGFSLPLGFALLIAGIIALRRETSTGGTLATWPIGYSGSWQLLVPGLIVTLGPSMLATATDPQTWRAILVIALALAAILLGSLTKLAAPFVLGIIVLPIENVLVFAVQIGRQIGATPWWITLATAGAALLVIAATSERRSAGGTAARIRDLA
jgi:hypothetical protein